jgi:hypothetical protein
MRERERERGGEKGKMVREKRVREREERGERRRRKGRTERIFPVHVPSL